MSSNPTTSGVIEDLENQLGRAISSKELAAYLAVDRRTIIKYADRWGGVEIAPVHGGSLKIE